MTQRQSHDYFASKLSDETDLEDGRDQLENVLAVPASTGADPRQKGRGILTKVKRIVLGPVP